jgi:cardiolipin synthase A/B
MKLIVQPEDGLAPILEAVRRARKSIEIMIFRFDRPELERALATALDRGISVRALIAHTNSEGERGLRKLELRLLEAGLTVTRTNDDLVRYHSKYLVVDRRRLFVLGFNFTSMDIRRSRSFGLEVRKPPMVQDILRLFEADAARQDYTPSSSDVVVSPVNARARLSAFIKGARKQLLIYDPKLSDLRMIALLHERIKAGVDVRVIGSVGKAGGAIPAVRLARRRLHVRAIVRDGSRAFVGSQSLRRLELDQRRELGLVVRASSVVKQITTCFEKDWAASVRAAREDAAKLPQPVLAAMEQEAATLA